ncbi:MULTISPECIES: GNAT family N-acetyltransferase [Nonomuraea]|uniref:GNAT family N-acetyltransferase n=1 Tax=Nonomuraea TaxID=83681 RepID=UPI001C5CE62F|nr:GNAT family N-acetyltransferase [Nonomuraea ceibae]
MTVRQATPADAEAIAGIHVRSWQAAYRGLMPQDHLDGLDPAARLPRWRRLLGETAWPRSGILVAEDDGGVTGFTGFGPARDPDQDPASVAEITTLYLAPEAWGRGIGGALLGTAVDALTGAGYGLATLWVLDTNARARRFYEALGWRGDGTVKPDDLRGFPLTEVRYALALRT